MESEDCIKCSVICCICLIVTLLFFFETVEINRKFFNWKYKDYGLKCSSLAKSCDNKNSIN